MRTYHYAILFAIIAIIFVTIRDVSYAQVSTVNEKNREYDRCFTRAVDAAVNKLLVDESGCVYASRDAAFTTFFDTLTTALDLNMDTEGKKRLEFFLPIVAIADEDGIYMYCYQEEYESGKHLNREWSERIPYAADANGTHYEFTLSGKAVYLDADRNQIVDNELTKELEAVRINTISSVIEQSMTKYINEHNKIAEQCGIQYEFHLPLTDDSIDQRAIVTPTLLILFQGYPLNGQDDVFDCFAFAGSSIRKRNYYIITKQDWYYLYHREDCEVLKKTLENNDIEQIICNTKEDCAKHGAFPCPYCMDHTGDYSYLK